ncbi:entericidin A/B family lipoprotein [Roseovarius aestuarii]|uniref:Entericidin EcnA/B family protein n=1 Tax=Roseovarius aestuarii TaxID=475083 RepID=A0A1X7BXS2_9RHOB|nr:entericidin A/B family lipoprotein [Roseovarius aestuarii]SMC14290.1 Entericidin EcnA/B family protein [Roseovarius aestuarii]
MIRLLTILSLFALTACETVEGFGRDLKKAGDKIEEEASEG